ncbi:cyclase family protein [Bacillus fonticola]|uniref:cyclase family protein n=1 Tax=Bacillus fonticola TaxID=2728853 RepID=UPI001472E89F|nr:cyclase family protein [Bacillus fonticola]
MATFYDVTAPIYTGMAVYKNKEEKQPSFDTKTNGHVTETRVSLDVHTGTHVDAPLHMINDGATIETIDMNRLVRPVKVLDLTNVQTAIEQTDLEQCGTSIEKDDFLLFKTRNSAVDEFDFEFVYLHESGARYLAEIGVDGVGIDSLGVERAQEGHPTHRTLMQHDTIIMEGLRLQDVPAGSYFMVAAPMNLLGTDASPARVLLFTKTPSL